MRKINIKIGGVIILFAIVLSAITVIVFLWFGRTASNTIEIADSSIGGIIVLSSQEVFDIQVNQTAQNLQAEHIIVPSDFSSYYFEQILSQLPFIMIVLCMVIIVFSFLLWRVLLYLQRKSSIQLVQELNTIPDKRDYLGIEPVFSAVYQKLKQRFDSHIMDYKRLHSYLSHEQKNAIAILRTEWELSKNTEQIKLIDRVSNSIDDILTLSESTEETAKAEVDVSLICAEVCDAYKNATDKISFSFNENGDHTIYAKERWIYRAVSNLIDNAIKYGEGKPIEVSVNKKKYSVIVSVKDYGIGMDEAAQEKIFNHRYRINELKKDGYGIGLSLVAHVCDLCSGFSFVESKKNEGSTFYLSFPEMDAGINIQ